MAITLIASGTLVSRRHVIWGNGITIITSRGVARQDAVEQPLDEAKTGRLMLGSVDGGVFNGRAAPPQEVLSLATEFDHPLPPEPTSTLVVTPTASIPPTVGPLVVNFAAAATGGFGPYTYLWHFGDGATSTLATPAHTYAQSGSFAVSVDVTDTTGFVRTTTFAVYAAVALAAVVTAVPVDGSAPLTVQLDVTPANGTAPYAYLWAFGDGATSAAKSPTHTYASPDVWLPTVRVTDATGHVIQAALAVPVVPNLVSDPWAIPNIGPVGLPVTFIANQSGGNPPYTYFWDFADGHYSTERDPKHIFEQAGFYNVNLVLIDSYNRYFSIYVAVHIGDVTPLAPPLELLVLPLELQLLFEIRGISYLPLI